MDLHHFFYSFSMVSFPLRFNFMKHSCIFFNQNTYIWGKTKG